MSNYVMLNAKGPPTKYAIDRAVEDLLRIPKSNSGGDQGEKSHASDGQDQS